MKKKYIDYPTVTVVKSISHEKYRQQYNKKWTYVFFFCSSPTWSIWSNGIFWFVQMSLKLAILFSGNENQQFFRMNGSPMKEINEINSADLFGFWSNFDVLMVGKKKNHFYLDRMVTIGQIFESFILNAVVVWINRICQWIF